ncbi:MAG: hypothetical protein ACXWEF_02720 [Solirubrobacterales bacterium]
MRSNHSPSAPSAQPARWIACPSGESLPEGQTLHIAGATDDGGWVIVAIHEDKGSWERFRDDVLGPGLQGAEGGLQGPPEETGFEVGKQQTA